MGWNYISLVLLTIGSSLTHQAAELDTDNFISYLSQQFLDERDDFAGLDVNNKYFPLSKSYVLTHGASSESYEEYNRKAEKFATDFRGFKPVPVEKRAHCIEAFFDDLAAVKQIAFEKEKHRDDIYDGSIPLDVLYILPFSIRAMLPLKLPTAVDPQGMALMVNEDPKNYGFLHKMGQVLRVAGNFPQKERFVEGVHGTQDDTELGFILGYRWNVGKLDKRIYSMRTVAKLPVDTILAVDAKSFEQYNLTTRLTEASVFSDMPAWKTTAWYLLADNLMVESYLKDRFNSYKHLLLQAPLKKMISYMEYQDAQARADIISSNDLIPVRVQEIFKTLDLKEFSADDEDLKVINLIFSILHKLDIDQIDKYYGNEEEFSNLYSKRHELEKLWLDGSQNVPWPSLKYVALKHWPSSASLNRWVSKELLIFEKFAFALSLQELNDIPAKAFMESTIKNMISDRMTRGQLYIIFEKFIEAEKQNGNTRFDPPSALYPCLHSSVLSGLTDFFKEKPDFVSREMFAATRRFTPAQIVEFMYVIQNDVWKASTLELILDENIHLLDTVATWEFKKNLPNLLQVLKKLGKSKFEVVAEKIKRLPRRLLNAWLEETVVLKDGGIDVNVLLDRPPSIVNGSDVTDLYEVLMNGQLASLALPGITCDMIEKILPAEMVEVLSNYRLSLGEDMLIPSDVRRCFASMVRKYLALKSGLFKIEAESEVELLSLLSTADIRGIGGEILLTWGKLLMQIIHPEVAYEVMQMIGSNVPHIFLHNGVSLDDIKEFAKFFHRMLTKKHGAGQFVVLKKLQDLMPYHDDDLSVAEEDIKAYVTTVLNSNPWARSICIPQRNRERFRDMILKGFGAPESWTSLDLVYLGDLLVVMSKEDLMKVSVESVRRALPELIEGSKYGTLLPEIRGHEEPVLYHEACAAWLNDGDSVDQGEGKSFIDAYENLAYWHMAGASVMTSYLPKHESSRKKRQTSNSDLQDTPEVNFKVLHDKVVAALDERMKLLTREDKIRIANLYQETKELLGNGTMILAGYDPTKVSLSDVEVLENIKQAKENGELDVQGVVSLALDAQIHLIRELSAILKLTAEDLGISAVVYEDLKNRDTFVDTEKFMATAVYNFTTAPPSLDPVTTKVNATGDEQVEEVTGSSIQELDDAMKFDDLLKGFNTEPSAITETTEAATDAPTTTKVPETPAPTTITSAPITVPSSTFVPLSDLDVKLSCDVLRTVGKSACMLRPEDLTNMEDDISDCIEVLGQIDFSANKRSDLWKALKKRLSITGKIESGSMINLDKFLPEIARSDPDLLDISPQNIDAVSVLGKRSTQLVDRFIANLDGGVEWMTIQQVKSLGRMVCGFTVEDWNTKVLEDAMPFTLPQTGELDCQVSQQVRDAIFEKHIEKVLPKYDMVDRDIEHWTVYDQRSSALLELGWLIGTFPDIHLQRMPTKAVRSLPYSAFTSVPDLGIFSPDQMEKMSPHLISLVRKEQFGDYLFPQQRAALHAAGGEDPAFIRMLDEYTEEIAELDHTTTVNPMSARELSDGSGSITLIASTFLIVVSILFTDFI